MATTEKLYDGDETPFTITFQYIEDSDIQVQLNTVIQTINTHYTIVGGVVVFDGSISLSGTDKIVITRVTGEDPKVAWTDAVKILPSDLDKTLKQPLYTVHELKSSTDTNTTNIATNTANIATQTGKVLQDSPEVTSIIFEHLNMGAYATPTNTDDVLLNDSGGTLEYGDYVQLPKPTDPTAIYGSDWDVSSGVDNLRFGCLRTGTYRVSFDVLYVDMPTANTTLSIELWDSAGSTLHLEQKFVNMHHSTATANPEHFRTFTTQSGSTYITGTAGDSTSRLLIWYAPLRKGFGEIPTGGSTTLDSSLTPADDMSFVMKINFWRVL